MSDKRGKLVLIGGTRDRLKNIKVFEQTLSFTDTREILIIPSAVPEEISVKLGEEYKKIFQSLSPFSSVKILDIQKPADLITEENRCLIDEASLVFFTGGSQSRLAAIFRNSSLIDLLVSKFLRGGVDIAGTSAGASVMGELVIYSDQEIGEGQNFFQCSPGFNILEGLVIDSHVLERNRIFRLAKSLVENPGMKGLGLSEDSGVLIQSQGMMKVFGENPVLFLSCNEKTMKYSSNNEISMDGLRMGLVSDDGVFDFTKWCLQLT